jgi:hypothetical protein
MLLAERHSKAEKRQSTVALALGTKNPADGGPPGGVPWRRACQNGAGG